VTDRVPIGHGINVRPASPEPHHEHPITNTPSRTRENDMKVSVDFDTCASTGACMQVCPEVFEVRSDGYLYILQEEPGPELADKVKQAADLCPTGAITVED
jgi:ferredoxin